MKSYFCVVLLAATAAAISIDHLTNKLQPVQSLYVKPSADGNTGDLYVAASEDNGISRWLTDNPVNFLNQAAMALKSATIMPTNLSPGFAAANPFQEEAVTENKAASNSGLSAIFGSSQIGAEPKHQTSKPAAKVEIVQNVQPSEISSAVPALSQFQYSPYQFMYPNLYAAAANDQKEAEENDVNLNAALAQAQAAYWPNAAYSYATYPYMMMDPRFWAWAQAATAAANQAPANTEGASPDENLRE